MYTLPLHCLLTGVDDEGDDAEPNCLLGNTFYLCLLTGVDDEGDDAESTG